MNDGEIIKERNEGKWNFRIMLAGIEAAFILAFESGSLTCQQDRSKGVMIEL